MPASPRPFALFFPLAALSTALAVGIWLAALSGRLALPANPTLWHAHEMLFGFASAVVAGFVLTAVANWTGRVPAGPRTLAALAGLWLVGRGAALTALGGTTTDAVVAVADLGFLAGVALVMTRVLIAARNLRNLVFVPLLFGLAGIDLVHHLAVLSARFDTARTALTLTAWLVGFLLVFMGGRVIPFFSGRRLDYAPKQWPALNWLSTLAALGSAFALTFVPMSTLAAILAGVTAVTTAVRLAAWQTPRLYGEPMLWILHAGYTWVVVAYALAALVHAGALDLSPTAPLHALTAGGLGCLALGMMTRVALGHSGRPIKASPVSLVAFCLIVPAGLSRLAAYADWAWADLPSLTVSAILWTVAFGLYALEFIARLWLPSRARTNEGGHPHGNRPAS